MTYFLDALANQIDNQYLTGENNDPTRGGIFQSLGDFAGKVDQSAERRYVEEGYLRRDIYNTDPKQLEVLFQEPNATVLVKKRMFSSLANNYRPDYMDEDEKIYFKAIKILFSNKCKQISALEKLSKIQTITSAAGNVPEQMVPVILTLVDTMGSIFGASESFSKVIEKVRKLYANNITNPTTTWINNTNDLINSKFGGGTGVIEITNFKSLSAKTSVNSISGPGTFSLQISDPYECMVITDVDIENAISDATNLFYNYKIYQFGKDSADGLISESKARLNQFRALRNASTITFKVNPDAFLGKRVMAIVDKAGIEIPFVYDSTGGTGFPGLGGFSEDSVHVSDDYLRDGMFLESEGLDSKVYTKGHNSGSELQEFKKIIGAIYNKLQLEANSKNAFQTANQKTNYARRNLRFNFLGKLIIQPMDTVSIYINSKSRYDNKLLSGLNNMFTGLGMLQNLNKTATDLSNSINTLLNPDNMTTMAEKSAFVGQDFPSFLWSFLRGSFVNEKEGTHVFAGLVSSSSSSWGGGAFTINIGGEDNTAYFDMGKINFNPGTDSWNGMIYDQLTPFKSSFDTVSGNTTDKPPELLNENKILFLYKNKNDAPLVKYKSGPNAGKSVSENNIYGNRVVDPVTGDVAKTFYAPDGLVYKWKSGIGAFIQYGSSQDLNLSDKVGVPNMFTDPFAGHDIMNVLSLLITGVPYNFATFWKTVQNMDGAYKDPYNFADAAGSYFASLQNGLIKNNTLWGNFIPFKNLTIDEQSFAKILQGQFKITTLNNEIDSKLKEYMDLNQSVRMIGASINYNPEGKNSDEYAKIKNKADQIKKDLSGDNGLIKQFQTESSNFPQVISFGDDTSFNSSGLTDSGKNEVDTKARKQLRKQLNFMTRRMSYNVRANEDKNLFIVDDFYDKDYDIAAYNKALTDGIKMYNSEFTSVREKIKNTASLLNLEVFCDTQGHIRVRPPQYNKMPSSVFYRMMALKKTYGIQYFPQFLSDVFTDQLQSLQTRLEIIECEIRLYCAICDQNSDEDAINFIMSNAYNYSSGGPSFDFIFPTDAKGVVQSADIKKLFDLAHPKNPDDQEIIDLKKKYIGKGGKIKLQSESTKNMFDSSQRYQEILNQTDRDKDQTIKTFNKNTRIDDLINNIQSLSGQKISKEDYYVVNSLGITASVDTMKATKQLASKIAERQKVLKLFYSSIKGAIEFTYLDNDANNSNALLTPGSSSNSEIPEALEHMIEDETYDDYGQGSGSRYVIKRCQIRSINISENIPPNTSIKVNGTFNEFMPGQSTEGLNGSFEGSGNGLTTAQAIDYDLWRNYGFRSIDSTATLPFLHDPKTQCAPYAVMLLSRNRKNILKGSLTISGNEYMQPGDVIFLEDRGLLFYVEQVDHNFTFGSSFTTALTLTYGHSPGEYIPSPLDMVGKLIYNNKSISDLAVQRQSNNLNYENIGIVQKDEKSMVVYNMEGENQPKNRFSDENIKSINNICYSCAYKLNNNKLKENKTTAKIELRIYYDKSTNTDLKSFGEAVKQLLQNPTPMTKDPKQDVQPLKDVEIIVMPINMKNDSENRSPSQKALAVSRDNYQNQQMASTPEETSADKSKDSSKEENKKLLIIKDKIRNYLYKYVIDCWISYTPSK